MGSTSQLTVMTIDDEPSIRTLVRMTLERDDDFEFVGEAATGAQGLELAAKLQPDVILLDLRMPDTDGHALLPHLLRDAPGSMVLVLSGVSGREAADRSFALGAFAYVEKSAVGDLPGLIKEFRALFERALDGETVWAPGDPNRVRQ